MQFPFDPYQTHKETQRNHRLPQNIALYMFWKTLLIPYISTLFMFLEKSDIQDCFFIHTRKDQPAVPYNQRNSLLINEKKFFQAIKQEPADLLV